MALLLRSLSALVVAAFFATLCPGPAWAQQRQLSPYEQQSVDTALAEVGGEIEPQPEGKIVESVEVVTLDVIEPRDPAPGLLNWFHVTTLEAVIRGEVLLRKGQPYDAALVQETERNFRENVQISVALVVPVKGSTPDKVRIVVVTKDVWSLRLNWAPTFVNGKLTYLSMQPSETNVFGTWRIANMNLIFAPDTITTGVGYYDPRVGGSRLRMNLQLNAVLDCQNRDVEGSTGYFLYGKPLYSTLTKWSYQTAVSWANLTNRIGNPAQVRAICSDGVTSYPAPGVLQVAEVQDPRSGTSELLAINEFYKLRNEQRVETVRSQVNITRSFGRVYKHNLSFGAEARHTDTYTDRFPEVGESEIVASLTEANNYRYATARESAVRDFDRRYDGVPSARAGPYVQLRSYESRYRRTLNIETFGLQEFFQVGHDVWLRLSPGYRWTRKTGNSSVPEEDVVWGLFAGASYTHPIETGYIRGLVAMDSEVNNDDLFNHDSAARSDNTLILGARVVSPQLGFGRFVTDVDYRENTTSFLRGRFSLSRTTGLRGYTDRGIRTDTTPNTYDYFIGSKRFLVNLELRTRPLLFLSSFWGLVFFYDAGDAFDEWAQPAKSEPDQLALTSFNPRSGAGVGLRLLLPQLDRSVFRVDFGFPVNRDDPRGEFTFIAAFGQAIGAPVAFPNALILQ